MKFLKTLIFNSYIIIFLLSFLLSIIFTFPSILAIDSAFIGDGGDNYQYASYQGLAAQHIKQGEFPFRHTDFWRFPVGFDFARGFDFYLSVTLGALLNLFVSLPLAYNLSIFILMFGNAILSYILFRYLTNSKILGTLGAIIYGFSFYTLARAASHPNLAFVGGFPLFVYALLRTVREEKNFLSNFLMLEASIILITSGSVQYALFLALSLFLFYPFLFYFYRPDILLFFSNLKKHIFPIGISLVISCFILLLLLSSHLLAALHGNLEIINRDKVLFEATPSITDYFLPNSYLPTFMADLIPSLSNRSIEKAIFMGFIELALFLLFFLSNQGKKLKLLLGILFIIPFVLSLGYGQSNNFFLLPYRFLFYIPPFNLTSETGRYFVIFYLFLTIGVVLFLKSLSQKNPWAKVILPVILIGLILERLPTGFYLSPDLKKSPYIEVAAKLPSKAILDLPLNPYYSPYNLLSLYYKKPIVNGYFHWSADGSREKAFFTDRGLISRYSCSETDSGFTSSERVSEQNLDILMLDLLKKNEVKTIVVHKDYKFFHPVCKNVRMRLSRLFPFNAIAQLSQKDKEKKITARAWTGFPLFNIYLPYEGTFYIDGVYFDPSQDAELKILVNSKASDLSYSWAKTSKGFAKEIFPKYSLAVRVPAGSTISFSSDSIIDDSTFSIWYRYVKENDLYIPQTKETEKVFEDNEAIVYRLN